MGLWWYIAPNVRDPFIGEFDVIGLDQDIMEEPEVTAITLGATDKVEVKPGKGPMFNPGDTVRVSKADKTLPEDASVIAVTEATGPNGGDELEVASLGNSYNPGGDDVRAFVPSAKAGEIVCIQHPGNGTLNPGGLVVSKGDFARWTGTQWEAFSARSPVTDAPGSDTGDGVEPVVLPNYGQFMRIWAYRETPADCLVGCHRAPDPLPSDWTGPMALQAAKDHFETVMGFPPSEEQVY